MLADGDGDASVKKGSQMLADYADKNLRYQRHQINQFSSALKIGEIILQSVKSQLKNH